MSDWGVPQPPPRPYVPYDGMAPAGGAVEEAPYRAQSQADEFELKGVHLETLETIFAMLDDDRDGYLNKEQLCAAITAVGIPPGERLVDEFSMYLPPDKAERGVDFATFQAVMLARLKMNPIDMLDMAELFKHFVEGADTTFVHADALRRVLKVPTANNTQLSDRQVDEVFKYLSVGEHDSRAYPQFLGDVSSGFINFTVPDDVMSAFPAASSER